MKLKKQLLIICRYYVIRMNQRLYTDTEYLSVYMIWFDKCLDIFDKRKENKFIFMTFYRIKRYTANQISRIEWLGDFFELN